MIDLSDCYLDARGPHAPDDAFRETDRGSNSQLAFVTADEPDNTPARTFDLSELLWELIVTSNRRKHLAYVGREECVSILFDANDFANR